MKQNVGNQHYLVRQNSSSTQNHCFDLRIFQDAICMNLIYWLIVQSYLSSLAWMSTVLKHRDWCATLKIEPGIKNHCVRSFHGMFTLQSHQLRLIFFLYFYVNIFLFLPSYFCQSCLTIPCICQHLAAWSKFIVFPALHFPLYFLDTFRQKMLGFFPLKW